MQITFNAKSVITRLNNDSVESSFLSPEVPPSPKLLVQDFLQLTGPVPFLANLTGFVTQLTEVTFSRHNVATRTCKVKDISGNYVTCYLHGRHSENQFLEDGAHIITFFALADNGPTATSPIFWLYDNSHLIIQPRTCIVPPLTKQVQF